MTDPNENTLPIDDLPPRCPHCAYVLDADATTCPRCGRAADVDPTTIETAPLRHARTLWPREQPGHNTLPRSAQVLLQFLPSGRVITLPLETPVMLGRGVNEVENGIDLNALNAHRHGVSRHHCLLQRRGTQLVVLDLGSTNGTYLNGEHLLPHHDYIVAHGDKLLLGSLHVIVTFTEL